MLVPGSARREPFHRTPSWSSRSRKIGEVRLDIAFCIGGSVAKKFGAAEMSEKRYAASRLMPPTEIFRADTGRTH
jgi:hypothetical protein